MFAIIGGSNSASIDTHAWRRRWPNGNTTRLSEPSGGSILVFATPPTEISITSLGMMAGRVRFTSRESLRCRRHGPLEMLAASGSSEDILAATSRLEGAFALIIWDRLSGAVTGIRDPLGLYPIYYRHFDNGLCLSDNLDAFGDETIDDEYVARFVLARGDPNTELTVRRSVQAVAPGSFVRWQNSRLLTSRYWTPPDPQPPETKLADAAAIFKEHVGRAVVETIDSDYRTWAHLSGGLDSSTVVSALEAQRAADPTVPALGGTITFQDSLGNGDESAFVDAVLQNHTLTNVRVVDSWPWQSDGLPPPVTDRPARDYPFYARDRHVAGVVVAAGGTSVLSGIGPDLYLPTTSAHCADLLWRGSIIAATKELHAWTVAQRGSLWKVAWSDGLLPLLRQGRRPIPRPTREAITTWFTDDFGKRTGIRALMHARDRAKPQRGSYYHSRVGEMLGQVATGLSSWLAADGLEYRHPLLHRPLVEFVLSLPPAYRTNVYWPKPVLRTAMKGILPEVVRTRPSKAVLAPRMFWAFEHERALLTRLLRGSVLADLGCIEPRRVLADLEAFDIRGTGSSSFLYALLSLETWLSVKSGRSL